MIKIIKEEGTRKIQVRFFSIKKGFSTEFWNQSLSTTDFKSTSSFFFLFYKLTHNLEM